MHDNLVADLGSRDIRPNREDDARRIATVDVEIGRIAGRLLALGDDVNWDATRGPRSA
jgi:hypothetical protein